MLFPAAFLQGIHYNGERPQYLNFGGIGAMIGHEMTHGFDALGRNFDENGKSNSIKSCSGVIQHNNLWS